MTQTVLAFGSAQDVADFLDELLQSRGFRAGLVSNASHDAGYVYVDVRGFGITWRLKVEATFRNPGRLPGVCLVSPIRLLAHVAHDLTICIDDGQGLSIDTSRQRDQLAFVLCDAVQVLEGALLDTTHGAPEFFNELEGYWEGIPNGLLARSSVKADLESRFVYGHVQNMGKGRQVCWYFTERTGARPAEFDTGKLANFIGLYVALDCNVPPPTPGSLLDTAFVERLLAASGPKEQRLWEELLRRSRSGQRRLGCMLVSQPRQAGGRSLIGLTFNLRKGKLDPGGQVRHLVVRRHTADYMRERGGASTLLSAKRVAILGCGSVGSEIADTLASCGVGQLVLVDYDTMDIQNVFRHVLGKDSVGLPKVEALKGRLAAKYPGLDISVAKIPASSWLATAPARHVDAFVLAIGNPAIERTLVRQIRCLGVQATILVTWLEALGLGGHVVVLPSQGEGCLDCLYRDGEGQPSLYPAVSLLAPGQRVSRSLSGCLGTFIPYSALHSRRTALLAAEALLEALADARIAKPGYTYWVGSDLLAQKEGILTSAWFQRAGSETAVSATRVLFASPCGTCRAERQA